MNDRSMAENIWIKNELHRRDSKVCFRKKIVASFGIKKLELSIWADSRYYLWVNRRFIGTGPSRSWPDYPQKDNYSLKFKKNHESIQIAVLVWHFGTSNSQYVHGPAGLLFSGKVMDDTGKEEYCHSGTDWKSRLHSGYLWPVPRINVSQPTIEMFNDSAFPGDWMEPDFDDSSWDNSVAGSTMKLDSMPDRDIPLLSSVFRYPETVVRQHMVKCRGIGIRVDYKEAFYPHDTTTEDRLQSGYLCWIIASAEKQTLIFTLADRLWPETEEYIYINGSRKILAPGEKEIELQLENGKNLFMLDISGARQRFTADIHFNTESPIKFLPPLSGHDSLITAAGPFESVAIGNIVCADGFEIDMENSAFLMTGRCKTPDDLIMIKDWLHPVQNTLFNGVKLKDIHATFSRIQSQPLTAGEIFRLKASDEQGDHEIIFDMGIEVSGFLSFKVKAEKPAELDFRFCEYLADGKPEIPGDLDTSLRYVCSGNSETFRSLVRRGFRYFTIRNRSDSDVFISDLYIDEKLYPLEHRAYFTCSDIVLEDIWKMCLRTVELCSEDTLIDSPAFEQAFWTGDAYVMSLYHQYLFGNTQLTGHCLNLAAQSMDYSELPDSHLPSGVHLLLTAWAQLWMLTVYEYWINTADKEYIKSIYPQLIKAADVFFSHIDSNGLFRLDAWNMLDWAEMDTPYKGYIAHLNARLSACFRAVSQLAGILGLKDDEKTWKNRSEYIAIAADREFWNKKHGCYIDSIHEDNQASEVVSVQTNLMMMIYGCVPPDKEKNIRSFILNPPAEAVRPGSPFIAHFYYEYLFSQGMGTEALKGIKEQWQPMLETGTCWETFEGFYKDRLTRSYCHAWSSAPSYLFGAWILGIRPLEAGFKRILIAPVTSGLNSAEGRVPVPSGDVKVSWTITDGELSCVVLLPEGTDWLFDPFPGDWETAAIRVDEYRIQGDI